MAFDTNLPRSERLLGEWVPQVFSRRGLLLTSVSAVTSLVTSSTSRADDPKNVEGSVVLRASGHNLFRVRTEMELKGNVNVPNNPLVSRTGDVKLPIKSKAVFDFEERYHRPEGADPNSPVTYAERYYHEASNESLLNRKPQSTKLRDSVRATIVRRGSPGVLDGPEVIYGVDDYFQRGELDLLRCPVSSMAADELLPGHSIPTGSSVSAGSRYVPTRDVMASVLNLSAVETTDVTVEVISISETEARLQFRGNVAGSLEGVPTTIRTIGKFTFDRTLGACTWLAMAIHETREVGRAEPGFDVSATIRMIRKPLQQANALGTPADTHSVSRKDLSAPVPTDRLYVDLSSDPLGFSVLMNRDWRMMNDVPGTAMMRMIANDRSIAQCDFRPLVALKPGTQWTLEAFQQDIKKTLGEQLSELIEADQRVSSSDLRVLRVTASGAVEGVPIQWVLMHFSDDLGRRLLATFTMEGDHVEKFAGADVQMADSLRFTELPKNAPETVKTDTPAKESSRLAKANSAENSDDVVGSASELK